VFDITLVQEKEPQVILKPAEESGAAVEEYEQKLVAMMANESITKQKLESLKEK
jgi:hypothetical protein